MKRTKDSEKQSSQVKKRADLILTSDWHLRETQPVCRTDDFWKAQWDKVKQISDLQEEHDCYIIHAGDLFHHWKPSPYLLTTILLNLPNKFFTVYGQHDLPNHNLNLEHKCGIKTLHVSGALDLIVNGHYGSDQPGSIFFKGITEGRKIGIWHNLIWQDNPPHWDKNGLTAEDVLMSHSQYDLIVTGDNHQSFWYTAEGDVLKPRHLVNPGSITRQTADQAKHKPCVYLWYASTNTVEPHYLDIEDNVISREHIEKIEERDGRIDAFIEQLGTDWEAEVSFESNLEKFSKENNLSPVLMEIIRAAIA